jgi:hypothetical protein
MTVSSVILWGRSRAGGAVSHEVAQPGLHLPSLHVASPQRPQVRPDRGPKTNHAHSERQHAGPTTPYPLRLFPTTVAPHALIITNKKSSSPSTILLPLAPLPCLPTKKKRKKKKKEVKKKYTYPAPTANRLPPS